MHRDPAEQAQLYRRFAHRSGLSERTAEIYARRIDQFTTFLTMSGGQYDGALTDEHVRDYAVRDWRRRLLTVDKLSPSTVQQHMTAISSFYEWLTLGKPLGIGVDVPAPRKEGLTEDALRKVMRAAKVSGPRDYALMATMAYAGLRVGEVHALDADDVLLRERVGRLDVRYGKGGKPRQVPANAELRSALREWLDARPGDPHTGPLWLSRTGTRLSQRSIQEVVTNTGSTVGVAVTPHVLRHTFARRMVDQNVPTRDVQELMGHASAQTTAGYTQPTAANLENAVEAATVDL